MSSILRSSDLIAQTRMRKINILGKLSTINSLFFERSEKFVMSEFSFGLPTGRQIIQIFKSAGKQKEHWSR